MNRPIVTPVVSVGTHVPLWKRYVTSEGLTTDTRGFVALQLLIWSLPLTLSCAARIAWKKAEPGAGRPQ